MTRSKRLKTVVDVAEVESSKAGQELHHSREQQAAQQRQLEQLLQFQQEYKARLDSLSEGGVDARQLQNFRIFLQQLGHAVDQQQHTVDDAGEQVNQQQQAWLARYYRKSTLEDALNETIRQERQELERREQREADERINSQSLTDWSY